MVDQPTYGRVQRYVPNTDFAKRPASVRDFSVIDLPFL
jgi:hypothetical protein